MRSPFFHLTDLNGTSEIADVKFDLIYNRPSGDDFIPEIVESGSGADAHPKATSYLNGMLKCTSGDIQHPGSQHVLLNPTAVCLSVCYGMYMYSIRLKCFVLRALLHLCQQKLEIQKVFSVYAVNSPISEFKSDVLTNDVYLNEVHFPRSNGKDEENNMWLELIGPAKTNLTMYWWVDFVYLSGFADFSPPEY